MINNLIYISPNKIIKNSASSIHILSMCDTAYKKNLNTFLIAASNYSHIDQKVNIINFFGKINFNIFNLNFKKINYGIELSIALYSFYLFLFRKINTNKSIIISRNIYSSFFLTFFFKKKIFYETHIVENKFRGLLQKYLLKNNYIVTICISNSLKKFLLESVNYNHDNIQVMHDAAFDTKITELEFLSLKKNIILKHNLKLDNKLIGYFGSLYKGRGVDIIIDLAKRKTDLVFFVIGGSKAEVKNFQKRFNYKNLIFIPQIKHENVYKYMKFMDILLMPYQKKVFVKSSIRTTEDWMSPLKMFEYMSSKKPIISSNLPSLCEVLTHKINAVLVKPDSILEWSNAIDMLLSNHYISNKISENAYNKFVTDHTWSSRINKIINYMFFNE